uniref:Uncharacterized protein n=1 Tax=Anguilla anguilla TaxID=7936 RepID=A0A0E9U9P4_ANGAN
MELGTSFPQRA